jgi:hypothetical protein
MIDTNIVIRNYLISKPTLTALVGDRIYGVKPLPESVTFPAIQFFTRGGSSMSEVPEILFPSVQFSCWDNNPIGARTLYSAFYNVMNGLKGAIVTIDGMNYYMNAYEEGYGQDIQETEINLWRVICFYTITIQKGG